MRTRRVRHPRRPGARAGAGARRLLRAAGERDGRPRVRGRRAVRRRRRPRRAREIPDPPGAVVHALVGRAGHAVERRAGAACGLRPAQAGVPAAQRSPRTAAGAVRVADRRGRRRVPAARGGVRATGLPGAGRDARRDHRGPDLLQRRGRDPRGRRRLGVARPAAGRGGGRARGNAGAGLRHRHLPGAAAGNGRAASVVFLFCATSFGVVLTLGGLRYSSVETEIYLLTTQLLDLRAAAALSILQLLAVSRAAGRRGPAPRGPRPDRGAAYGPAPAAGPPGPWPARPDRGGAHAGRRAGAHARGRVAAGRRRLEPRRTTGA